MGTKHLTIEITAVQAQTNQAQTVQVTKQTKKAAQLPVPQASAKFPPQADILQKYPKSCRITVIATPCRITFINRFATELTVQSNC